MRILLPTIRDSGQIGGTTTHLDMLSRGLEEIGHEARVFYLGDALPQSARDLGVVWPAGALNRAHRGWGMIYAAAIRGRLLAAATERELARAEAAGEPWEALNAQEVYSVPALRGVADRFGIPLALTLHGYPLYESDSEGYTVASDLGRRYLMGAEMRALRLADAVVLGTEVEEYDGKRFTPIAVHVGLADGRWTELLGGSIRPGDALVTSAVLGQRPRM